MGMMAIITVNWKVLADRRERSDAGGFSMALRV
jgi:hypothetical protein